MQEPEDGEECYGKLSSELMLLLQLQACSSCGYLDKISIRASQSKSWHRWGSGLQMQFYIELLRVSFAAGGRLILY